MEALVIGSVSEFSGKNLLALTLYKRLEEDGVKLGFLRPFGVFPVEEGGSVHDEDTVFFKQALRLKDAMSDICPVVRTRELEQQAYEGVLPNLMTKVDTAMRKVGKGRDLVIIPGLADLNAGAMYGLALGDLVRKFKARVIMVDKWDKHINRCIDGFLGAQRQLKGQLLGVVINRVPPDELRNTDQAVRRVFERAEIPLLGLIPEDPVLCSCTIKDIRDAVQGDIVVGRDKLADLVEAYQIGAMTAEGALPHFRKVAKKAVVVGGDRPEVQLAALETNTRALILTGGNHPNDIIISRASSVGTAVIVTKLDSQGVAAKLQMLLGYQALRNEQKVKQAHQVVRKYLDFDLLYRLLGFEVGAH